MTEQELMHFGIPGMRWGVRRAARKAENGAKLIRKVGGARAEGYAQAMEKKAQRIREGKPAPKARIRAWGNGNTLETATANAEKVLDAYRKTATANRAGLKGRAYTKQLKKDYWNEPISLLYKKGTKQTTRGKIRTKQILTTIGLMSLGYGITAAAKN